MQKDNAKGSVYVSGESIAGNGRVGDQKSQSRFEEFFQDTIDLSDRVDAA
jgi:hypothetical protein